MSNIDSLAKQLGVVDTSTLRKAEECLRILQTKPTVKHLNDSAKSILCIDLSAKYTGIMFDKDTAYKLSGLKKTAYQNNLHTIEKILGLDKIVSISDLCVQLSCTEVKSIAENILTEYSRSNPKITDLNHPQYSAISIYVACKIKKIKVDKAQIRELSRLKPSQWKELENDFFKFSESLKLSKSSRKLKNTNGIPKEDQDLKENKVVSLKNKPEEEPQIEEYEVWKKRIIEESKLLLNKNS